MTRFAWFAAVVLGGATPAFAQQPMTLEPAWEGRVDGRTEAELGYAARAVGGDRVYIGLTRKSDRGFSVRRIDARTGQVAWMSTYVSDDLNDPGGPVGEVVRDLALAPDGSEVFTIGAGGIRITRFRASDGRAGTVDVLPGAEGRQLAFTPSGNRLVARGDTLVAAYDVASGARLWSAPVPLASFGRGDLVADEARAYVLSADTVIAFDLSAGSVVWSLDLTGFGPSSLDKDAGDGPLLVSGGVFAVSTPGDGGSKGLDPATGAVLWENDLSGFYKLTALAPDGRVLYRTNISTSSSINAVLQALDAVSGGILWTTPLAQGFFVTQLEISLSADGVLLALPQLGGNMTEIYETAGGALVGEVAFSPSGGQSLAGVSFGPGDTTLVSFGREVQGALSDPPEVIAQDLDEVELWRQLVRDEGSAEDVLADAALSANGRVFYVGGEAAGSKLLLGAFEARDGRTLWTVDDEGAPGAELLAASDPMLFVAGGDELRAYRARNGAEQWMRAGLKSRGLAATSDGTALFVVRQAPAGGTSDYGVSKIAGATGADLWSMTFDGAGGNDRAGAITLSPDGETVFVTAHEKLPTQSGPRAHVVTLAIAEESGAVLWRAESNEGGNWNGLDLVASPDGTRVYVLGGDEKVDVVASRFFAYDAVTGTEIWRTIAFGAPTGSSKPPPISCALSGDGSRLAGVGYGFNVFQGMFLPIWRAFTVDTADGSIDWDRDVSVGNFTQVVDVAVTRASPTVIVGGQPGSKLLVGLDAQTGAELFAAGSAPSPMPGNMRVVAAPGGRRFYAAQTEGRLTSDLRAAAFDLPTLVSSASPVSLARGGVRELHIRAGSDLGGAFYQVLGSAADGDRGLASGGVLPFQHDPYFALSLQPEAGTAGLLRGFRGQLDADGEARATLRLPPGSDPALAGTALRHVALVTSADGALEQVTNFVTLTLEP